MTSTPDLDPSHPSFTYETSPHLYLFTSLTAGSSHVITATSRLETILKVHRIPFRAIDCATDEKARRIWGRRAGKRKLPGLVREGWVVADMEEVEEWNEDGVLKRRLEEREGEGEGQGEGETVGGNEQDSTEVRGGSGSGSAGAATAGVGTGVQISLPIREAPAQSGTDSAPPTSSNTTTPSTPLPTSTPDPTTNTTTTKHPLRPTTIAFTNPQDSFTGSIRSGSALATPSDIEPITASAGPTKLSGLAAVTNHPELLERSRTEGEGAEKARGRGREAPGRLPLPDSKVDAEVEVERGRNKGEGEKVGAAVGGAAQSTSAGAKVKFEEDQLKGDARDERAAEDSVGD